MLRRREAQNLETMFKTLRGFKVRMVVASLIYIVVTVLMKSNNFETGVPLEAISSIRYLFYALALLVGLLLNYLRNNYLAPKGADEQLLQRLRVSFFIVAAFFEVPILFGLIIFFMSGSTLDLYVLTMYALILLAAFAPRYRDWKEHTQHANQFSQASY